MVDHPEFAELCALVLSQPFSVAFPAAMNRLGTCKYEATEAGVLCAFVDVHSRLSPATADLMKDIRAELVNEERPVTVDRGRQITELLAPLWFCMMDPGSPLNARMKRIIGATGYRAIKYTALASFCGLSASLVIVLDACGASRWKPSEENATIEVWTSGSPDAFMRTMSSLWATVTRRSGALYVPPTHFLREIVVIHPETRK